MCEVSIFHKKKMLDRLNLKIYTGRDLDNPKEEFSMKMWTSRFALLAVLGGLLCSALVVGCGSPEEEEAPAAGAQQTAPSP